MYIPGPLSRTDTDFPTSLLAASTFSSRSVTMHLMHVKGIASDVLDLQVFVALVFRSVFHPLPASACLPFAALFPKLLCRAILREAVGKTRFEHGYAN